MSAVTLRRAAALMRELAEAATPGPWEGDTSTNVGRVFFVDVLLAKCCTSQQDDRDNAKHIASWHPVVALAVAKAMDDVALAWEICDGWTRDLDDDAIRFEDTVDGGWLAVAHAYLGEQP